MPNASDYPLSFDRDLIVDLVLEFSRFEYSLKRSGLLVKGRDDAKPDWDSFAVRIRDQLSRTEASVAPAIQLLISRRPKKQVVTPSGVLAWRETTRAPGEALESYVLRLVRLVRNNLFHGGKFPYPDGPIQDQARDEALLRAGLNVLHYCRNLVPALESFFQEAA